MYFGLDPCIGSINCKIDHARPHSSYARFHVTECGSADTSYANNARLHITEWGQWKL